MGLYFFNSYLGSKKLVTISFFGTMFLIFGNVISSQAQPPTIASFSPTTVCQGDAVTITGTNFTGATNVKFGSLNATNITINDPTSITAYVAILATTGTVTVTTPAGTAIAPVPLTILPAPRPALTDVSTLDLPFTNCDGRLTYQITVRNNSVTTGTNNMYQIDWGDGSAFFTQTDWAVNAQTTHTFASQGYFNIVLTITPVNGCTKSVVYNFYNGRNPLAGLTTTDPTTGLCTPVPIEFQIGNWFNNSAGTTYQLSFGDGQVVTLTHPLNLTNVIHLISHTYTTSSCPSIDFTATLRAINGCFITTYTLNQIIIRKAPVANFTTPATPACLNIPVCFTNTTTNGFSGTGCSTTTSYTWDFGDGTTSSVANPPCHTYTAAGTYNVTLTASNTACGSDVRTKQVVVLPVSPLPVATPSSVSYCQGQAAVPLTATGTGLLWYTAPTGGTGSTAAPTPPTNLAPRTITYYVTQTLANNCESGRVPITVTINAAPNAPAVITPVQLCLNQTTGPLTATGTGLLWYTTATGGIGSPTAPTPSTAAIGNTTYYVSQTTNGCEGPRAAILVTVNSLAGPPGVTSPVTYCQNQNAVPLTATGSGLLWYTSATGGTGSTTAPTPSTGTVGSTIYYVSQVTGCGESPRASITVDVNAGPSASIIYSPANLCNVLNTASTPNPPIPVTLTGTAGGNYSISPTTGLSINATTGTLNPSGATARTYTITYTIPGTSGCPVFTTTTTVTVNGSPTAVITYPPALCTSSAPTNVNLTGAQGGTFASTPGLTIDASTGTITPATSTPATYSVTYTVLPSPPCSGFVATTSVTITNAPSASITYNLTNICNVVNTPSTPNLPIAVTLTGTQGGSYSISPSTGLPIDATTGTINPSGALAGSYTIKYAITGMGGCADLVTTTTVTVSGAPTAGITYPAVACTSNPAINAQLSGTQGGTFTSSAGLTINPLTGTITPATSIPGPYTITYTILPSSPCPGFITTTSITIIQAPTASITYNPANICNVVNTPTTPNLPITVTLTGTQGGSYSISPANGLPINTTTGTINPSGATPGNYTITYAIQAAGSCTAFTTTTTVTVGAAPTATINYPGSPYCSGINTPQHVSSTGTPGGVFSSGQGLSINTITGDINPALSTPGIYTVAYTIIASSPCPGYIATARVEINESPVLSFPIPVQSICSGGTAVYKPFSTVVNTIYSWSVVGSLPANVSGISSGTASGPNPAISLSFTNTGTASQSLNVRVIPANPSQNPCAGTPYDLTLVVNPVPVALTPGTVDFCMGTPPTALTVNPLPGNTIKWYDQNFVLLSATPVINTAVPAQFIYYVTQSNNYNCESPNAKILAIVHPTAKIISATYTNPTTCGIASGSIVLNVLDLNNNPIPNTSLVVHYDKFQTAYAIAASTDGFGKITIPLVAGTYSGIYVSISGCTSQKIPDVFILKDPNPPSQPVAGYNPPICTGTPLNLSAVSATSTQAGPVNYVWVGPAFGAYADTTRNTFISFPSPTVSDAGTYIVYAIQNNCISTPANFQVVIKQSPTKPVISTRTPLCVGDDLILQASSSIPGPDATLNYLWRGPGTGFPVNSPNAGINKVKVQDAGRYSITVTSPQTGCSSTSDTLIQVGGYPVVKFAQDSITLPTGYLLNLAPSITNAADPNILPLKTYEWTPIQDLTCNDAICSSPVATIKNNICYSVKVTNIYGCIGSAVICIKVFCKGSQVFIPNAFTPEGNIPENTRFMVRASGVTSVKSFRVFNRWGKIMFERNNFSPNDPAFGWDGRINGKLADPGVYVYTTEVICENGVPYFFQGNVTLL